MLLSMGFEDIFPEGLDVPSPLFFLRPPLYSQSPALHTFLLTASVLGPLGWVVGQILLVTCTWLDSGDNI